MRALSILSCSLSVTGVLCVVSACIVAGPLRAQEADFDVAMSESRCAEFGPGYVSVEGSQACVKTSGHVRVRATSRAAAYSGESDFERPMIGVPFPAGRTETDGAMRARLRLDMPQR